jgi:hypothetical protein
MEAAAISSGDWGNFYLLSKGLCWGKHCSWQGLTDLILQLRLCEFIMCLWCFLNEG